MQRVKRRLDQTLVVLIHDFTPGLAGFAYRSAITTKIDDRTAGWTEIVRLPGRESLAVRDRERT
jgi:hypothetical protein